MSVIGIDIDGTLAQHGEFVAPDVISKPSAPMVMVVKRLHSDGHTLCAWSCRADYVVKSWLKEHNLLGYFQYINQSPHITDSVKASFDVYIGDDAVSCISNDASIVLARVKRILKQGNLGLEEQYRDNDFSSHAPVAFFAGTGRMYIDMFEHAWREAWANKLYNRDKTVALLTICSHAKPYSKSFIHSMIRKRLYEEDVLEKIDYAHISTAGIVPSGYEMVYPFNAYDHDGTQMTEAAKSHFSDVTYQRIGRWLSKYRHDYKRVVFYLRDQGKTYTAAKRACEDVDSINTYIVGADMSDVHRLPFAALHDVDDCLVSETNLNRLIGAIKGTP